MADKKISELPLLNSVSGSSIIVPIVHDGTTVKLNLSQLAHYSSQWSAKTGSANTFTGNQTINGNLSVSGRITVNEVVAVYETASVVFSSGSNVFGDAPNDTHQFTGSVDINGTLLLNGSAIGLGQINQFTQSVESQLSKVYNATASLEQFTASQDGRNFIISEYTSSTDAHIVGISAFTSSQLAVNTGLASVTASFNSFSSSQLAVNTGLASVTRSLNTFTASQDSRNFIISQFTSSTDVHIVGISQFTSSQLAVNLGNAIYTSSVDNHIVGISAFTSSQLAVNFGISLVTASLIGITNTLMGFTASLDNTYATDAQLYPILQSTRSIELHSGSMVGITNGLMAYTSSNETWKTGIRGEISGIEAWTASLDNTYATDAQLYQLYQATRSLELISGSMIGITNGLMAFTAALDNTYATDAQLYQLYAATASLNTTTGSLKGELAGLEAYTASLKTAAIVSSSTQVQNYDVFALNSNLYTATGSLIGITNGLMAFTAALDNTYATDAQLYELYTATASINVTTGSLKGELAGLEAYTASLKTAAIVSSSTQIQNYDVFALNSNLYTSTGSIKDEIAGIEAYTASLKGAIEVSGQNVNVLGMITAQQFNVTYVSSSVMYQSGSTKFGNSADDKHEFTGSIDVSGSIGVDGVGLNASIRINNLTNTTGKDWHIYSLNNGNFGLYNNTDALYALQATSAGDIQIGGSVKVGDSNSDKHEITGSLNTSFGGNGGLFVNDGFQKTFTFATGNLFSIDFGSAEGGGFVDVTYGGVVTTIGGRGGATRYAISYKDANNAVATKVHGYGDDIVSASISATKVAIFSIAGDAVQSAKYQVNVSVNAVAADGSGNYDKILYNRL